MIISKVLNDHNLKGHFGINKKLKKEFLAHQFKETYWNII